MGGWSITDRLVLDALGGDSSEIGNETTNTAVSQMQQLLEEGMASA